MKSIRRGRDARNQEDKVYTELIHHFPSHGSMIRIPLITTNNWLPPPSRLAHGDNLLIPILISLVTINKPLFIVSLSASSKFNLPRDAINNS